MPPFRKFVKKSAKKAVRFARKRYATKTGGVRVKKIAQDVFKIQRMLNVEHKHLDVHIGTKTGASFPQQSPTRLSPKILALPLPIRSLNYNGRTGNQLKITHITAKYLFEFRNNTDSYQRNEVRARIIFAKNASDVPDIAQLLDQDANGFYTPNSFVNTQEYKKFLWLKSLDCSKAYTQPLSRYTDANNVGITVGGTQDVRVPTASYIHDAPFHMNKQSSVTIKVMYKNGTDNVEQMKPYLFLTSNVQDAASGGHIHDPIVVSANIRFTYVDN